MASTLSKASPSFTSRQAAPMQKRVAPASLARRALASTSSTSSSASRFEPGVLGVMGRLRAVFAVLGAGPGLDGKQAGELHLAVRVVAPVHRPRLVHEVEQGGREQADDLVGAPIVAGSGRAILRKRRLRPAGFAVDRIRGFPGF